jgi:4-hydroxy-3-methylbut-2-en-1-yl diphosphate synthase IspG/GcpE
VSIIPITDYSHFAQNVNQDTNCVITLALLKSNIVRVTVKKEIAVYAVMDIF